jgi:hypothetical protein
MNNNQDPAKENHFRPSQNKLDFHRKLQFNEPYDPILSQVDPDQLK